MGNSNNSLEIFEKSFSDPNINIVTRRTENYLTSHLETKRNIFRQHINRNGLFGLFTQQPINWCSGVLEIWHVSRDYIKTVAVSSNECEFWRCFFCHRPVIQLCGTGDDVCVLCAYHCHSNTIARKQNSTQSLAWNLPSCSRFATW